MKIDSHNHSISFDKYTNLDANEDLGISNLIFEQTTPNSDFEIHKHNTNYDEKSKLKDNPSSSFANFNYYQEDRYLEAELTKIEKNLRVFVLIIT